jgi:hypothetical protein
VNAARLTSAKGSSSWPTISVNESKNSVGKSQEHRNSIPLGTMAAMQDAANWPTPEATSSCHGHGGTWSTTQFNLHNAAMGIGILPPQWPIRRPDNKTQTTKERMAKRAAKHGQAAPASSSSLGSRQGLSWATARSLDGQINESLESWTARRDRKQAEGINLHRPLPIAVMQEQFPTPRTCDWKSSPNADSNIKRMEVGQATLAEFVHAKHKKGDLWSTPRTGATESSRPNNKGGIPLADQAKREQWATPQAKDHKSGHRDPTIVQYKQLNVEVEARATGKLNPRWVETLMGLPIGWTMPSCTSPQTIAPMSCGSSAMESCLPPQSGLLEC